MTDMTLTVPSTLLATDVQVFPASAELTVAQAAALLDAPVGYINELLDNGLLEFYEDAGCRLINRNYFIEYVQRRQRRDASFAEMVRLDQEMGLYDD
jgi:excisionase family DNA binding protein